MSFYKVSILGLAGKDTYTYRGEGYKRGDVVFVPFINKVRRGIVIGTSSPYERSKEIIKRLIHLPEQIVRLGEWAADYYTSTLGQSFALMIPPILKNYNDFIPDNARESHLNLTKTQEKLVKKITEDMDNAQHNVYLMFGVTGSGKTEIYLRVMEYVLNKGKGVIYLVPEIALVPQTIERIKARFPDSAEYHSYLSPKERFSVWINILNGKIKIVVGARMAVFAPIKDLGLIILDEEHSASYKQEDKPPLYNARDVALHRGETESAGVILGSATPSVESYYRAKKGEHIFLHLPERIGEKTMPGIKVVDMKKETSYILSETLREEIKEAYRNKKQVLLFINRRGFAPYLYCKNCGRTITCPKCAVSLTFHKQENILMCHHCGYKMEVPERCPYCGGRLIYRGIGTERVVSYISRELGISDIVRVDSDATKKKGAHKRIYTDIKRGKIGMIVGTQMITKGLDIPEISLVGIISADTSLNFPDFRSNERTFQLIMQAAGRCGRGKDKGKVIIQTLNPENFAIQSVEKYDYERFYTEELKIREEAKYPPFVYLGRIILNGKNEDKVKDAAYKIRLDLEKSTKNVLGPSPAPISKIRGKYYYHLLIKSQDRKEIQEIFRKIEKQHFTGIKIKLDPDPIRMM